MPQDKKAKRRQNHRRLWLAVHLYLGLTLGFVFSLTGLTGVLLVFYPQLDQWLNPVTNPTLSNQKPLSFEELFQRIQQSEPDRELSWRLEIPEYTQNPITARYYKPKETEHLVFAPLILTINPQTGEILAKRFWGEFVMTWLYDLHYALLLDKPGKIVMSIVGGLLLFSTISGVYLWWPPSGKLVSALTLKRNASPQRLNYDIHKLLGIYSLVIILILTLTGIALEIPQYVNPLFGFFSPLQVPPKPESTLFDGEQKRITLDEAVAAGKTIFPDARLCWIETPGNAKGSYRINLRQDFEPNKRFPKTNVWVDQYSGKIIAVNDPQNLNPSDRLIHWLHPLHSGEAFGLSGRILVLLSGVLLPVMFITGVIRWLQKKRSKKAAR